VIRWPVLAVMVLACSGVTEGAGGVVALEVVVPTVTTLEVGENLQLSARALDKDGNEVTTPVTWLSADATVAIDNTGLATGLAPGSGEVQAFAGSLPSNSIELTVIERADSVMLVGDSVVTIAPGVSTSAPVSVQVRNFARGEPLPARPVVYTLTFPPTVGHIPVQLPGGVLVDTVSTDATTLQASISVSRVAGVESPDTAFLAVRSYRPNGADVPGSGQRFIVLFQ
jgi:hypothetical protein